jgi:hypothetical protein
MARLFGPLHSLAASGTIADVLTFGQTKGRHIARRKPVADQPPTPYQRGNREIMRWLGKQWTDGLTLAEQESWDALPEATRTSRYAAYLSFNRARYKQNLRPFADYPGTASATAMQLTSAPNATGGTRAILIDYTLTLINDGWGLMIHANQTNGFTPTPHNLVAIFQPFGTTPQTVTITGFEPGTWYTRIRRCRRRTTQSTLQAQQTITVQP